MGKPIGSGIQALRGNQLDGPTPSRQKTENGNQIQD